MKAVAVIGPSQSGKSTLIEGIAHLEGARPQALNLLGGTRVTLFDFMDDPWAAIEVPGGHDAFAQVGPVLATCDAAVLCVAAQADAAVLAAPYLRLLERSGLPVFLFINKIDVAAERVSEIVASLQQYCGHGIVLRQVPIRDGDEITGAVDLISERAWEYHEDQRSSLIELPETMVTREQEARSDLLEAFADFDDALLEQIIEDQRPATDQVYSVATKVLRRHELVPALLGAAGHGNGLLRLMKSLRHEVPEIAALCKRQELPADTAAIACLADQWKASRQARAAPRGRGRARPRRARGRRHDRRPLRARRQDAGACPAPGRRLRARHQERPYRAGLPAPPRRGRTDARVVRRQPARLPAHPAAAA